MAMEFLEKEGYKVFNLGGIIQASGVYVHVPVPPCLPLSPSLPPSLPPSPSLLSPSSLVLVTLRV
jgi:hypothetical protein